MINMINLFQMGIILGDDTGTWESVDQLILLVTKLMFIAAALIYVFFAFIITRQISVMKRTLITPISPLITIIGYIHFIFAILVLIIFVGI